MNRKDWFTACSAVEKEALYRAELENYSEKLVVNGEGRIVFINEKYAAEFGKTPADIEGMTMAELFSRIKAPVILDIRDFDIPFIPHVDAVPGKSDGYIPIFIRSPLMDEKGAHVGDMIYDGQTWLRRYRGLYDKLNELVDEYQYLHAAKRSNTNARLVGSSTAVVQLKREILLGGQDQRHPPHRGRNGDRQGGGGQRGLFRQRPEREAVRHPQLRRHPAGAHRIRAFRL